MSCGDTGWLLGSFYGPELAGDKPACVARLLCRPYEVHLGVEGWLGVGENCADDGVYAFCFEKVSQRWDVFVVDSDSRCGAGERLVWDLEFAEAVNQVTVPDKAAGASQLFGYLSSKNDDVVRLFELKLLDYRSAKATGASGHSNNTHGQRDLGLFNSVLILEI